MKKTLELNDFEQLRVIADPLRRRLLEVFCQEPITTKQVAIMLGEKPTKLYHHVDSLEKAGFIKLVKTRQNRGTTEKYYQAVAKTFSVDRNLLDSAAPNAKNEVARLLINTLKDSLGNLIESVEIGLLDGSDEKKAGSVISGKFFLNRAKMLELTELIQTWLNKNAKNSASDKTVHQFTVAVFPIKVVKGKE